jgi:hypothetical protein
MECCEYGTRTSTLMFNKPTSVHQFELKLLSKETMKTIKNAAMKSRLDTQGLNLLSDFENLSSAKTQQVRKLLK